MARPETHNVESAQTNKKTEKRIAQLYRDGLSMAGIRRQQLSLGVPLSRIMRIVKNPR